MASEGASGPKVLDSMCMSIICCPHGEGFLQEGVEAASRPTPLHCCPRPPVPLSQGTGPDGPQADVSWVLPVSQAMC